jgi:hypothetical protein
MHTVTHNLSTHTYRDRDCHLLAASCSRSRSRYNVIFTVIEPAESGRSGSVVGEIKVRLSPPVTATVTDHDTHAYMTMIHTHAYRYGAPKMLTRMSSASPFETIECHVQQSGNSVWQDYYCELNHLDYYCELNRVFGWIIQ